MSDFESLLNAIPENPNVAFILADYLEEKGDPRCELLRLMYTLKDLKRSAPRGRSEGRTNDLQGAAKRPENTFEVTPERVAMETRLHELLFVENLEPVVPRYTNELEMEFVWIPPGKFLMGSPEDESGRSANEGPAHQVQLTKGFWLGRTPVTQRQWQEVMGNNPSHFQGDENRPVERVSWHDCQQFCEKVSQRSSLAIQLPTEAQWEYACRAGTETARYAKDLKAVAWYKDNSEGETHRVGQKPPNGWGLYDMLGNVWEWCHDGRREYTEDSVTDPVGSTDADAYRCYRGGSYASSAQYVRAAYRSVNLPVIRFQGIGFRGSSSGSS